jgi:hypothetical protein
MLHQAAGFLPVPKHALTFIGANADVQTQTNNVAVLPPVESSIKRWSDRFNAIAPPTPTPVKPPPEWTPLEEPDVEEPDEEEEPDTPDDNEPMTTWTTMNNLSVLTHVTCAGAATGPWVPIF